MTLKTQMTTDLSVFFDSDEFAESVTYTPTGGEATTITAIVVQDMPFQEPYVRGEMTAVCDLIVQRSEVSNPQEGDAFTFGGETWRLDPDRGVVYEDDWIYEIGLEREMS